MRIRGVGVSHAHNFSEQKQRRIGFYTSVEWIKMNALTVVTQS